MRGDGMKGRDSKERALYYIKAKNETVTMIGVKWGIIKTERERMGNGKGYVEDNEEIMGNQKGHVEDNEWVGQMVILGDT